MLARNSCQALWKTQPPSCLYDRSHSLQGKGHSQLCPHPPGGAPPAHRPLSHQEREKQLQANRDPIWTPTSPGRGHYLRDPDSQGHHHKGPRAAKIQTGGAATCKHNRVKTESNKERAQLPHPTPKPHSPHPWSAEGLLPHTQPHLSATTSLLCATQAELYRTWCRLHTGAVFLLPKGQRVCTCVLLRCSLLVVRRWGEGLIRNLEVMLKLWHWLLYTILRHFLLTSNLLSLFYCQMLHRKTYTFVNFFFFFKGDFCATSIFW